MVIYNTTNPWSREGQIVIKEYHALDLFNGVLDLLSNDVTNAFHERSQFPCTGMQLVKKSI